MPRTSRGRPRERSKGREDGAILRFPGAGAAAAPSREAWDVIVVGSGPAGSVAAALLASRGWGVALLDRSAFPREKVCGDGLLSDAVDCLRRNGLFDPIDACAHATDRLRVFSNRGHDLVLRGEYRTLQRSLLDDLLRQRAVANGAVFAVGRVLSVEHARAPGAVNVRIEGSDRGMSARVAVIATGADISLLGPLAMTADPLPHAVAVRAYAESAFPLDEMVVTYGRSVVPGYAWIFPMGGGRFNVGCGTFFRGRLRGGDNLKAMLDRFISGFPLARALFAEGAFVSRLRGAPLRCGLDEKTRLVSGSVVAVGETVGATYNLTGEGIGKAMETAELAAEAIDESLRKDRMSLLSGYPASVRERLLPRYRGYRIAEEWLSIPWVNDLLANRARHSAFVQDSLEGIIDGTVDPRAVFSFKGVMRSFWR